MMMMSVRQIRSYNVLYLPCPLLSTPLPPPRVRRYAFFAAVDAVVVDARHSLADHLSPAPTPIDDLVREFGDDSATVAAALLELELAGRIERYPGNRVALVAA